MLVPTAERGCNSAFNWLAARRWCLRYTVTCYLSMRSPRTRFLRSCQRRCALIAESPPLLPNTRWGKTILIYLHDEVLCRAQTLQPCSSRPGISGSSWASTHVLRSRFCRACMLWSSHVLASACAVVCLFVPAALSLNPSFMQNWLPAHSHRGRWLCSAGTWRTAELISHNCVHSR